MCHTCQSSLATLANSSNVQQVSKRCATRVKSRSLRSRIPAGGPEGPTDGALNSGISGRNCDKNDKNGQWTDPSTGESHDKSCQKMTKMATARALQQRNSLWKVAKNDKNGQNHFFYQTSLFTVLSQI